MWEQIHQTCLLSPWWRRSADFLQKEQQRGREREREYISRVRGCDKHWSSGSKHSGAAMELGCYSSCFYFWWMWGLWFALCSILSALPALPQSTKLRNASFIFTWALLLKQPDLLFGLWAETTLFLLLMMCVYVCKGWGAGWIRGCRSKSECRAL